MRKVSKPEGEQNEGERVRVNKRNTLSLTVAVEDQKSESSTESHQAPDEISDDESLGVSIFGCNIVTWWCQITSRWEIFLMLKTI